MKKIILLLLGAIPLIQAAAIYNKNIELLKDDTLYEALKYDLVWNYGLSDSFAEEFQQNLRKAINQELVKIRQRQDEDEDEDDEVTIPPTTTPGASPSSILSGVYGILKGVGTLNPDAVFTSTANFFPPSQKNTVDALVNSALGTRPSTWPTTTTTTSTTTKPTTSTKDPDDEDDDDEDNTTKVATQQAVTQASAAVATVTQAASVAVQVQPLTAAPQATVTQAPVQAPAPAPAQTAAPVQQG